MSLDRQRSPLEIIGSALSRTYRTLHAAAYIVEVSEHIVALDKKDTSDPQEYNLWLNFSRPFPRAQALRLFQLLNNPQLHHVGPAQLGFRTTNPASVNLHEAALQACHAFGWSLSRYRPNLDPSYSVPST